MTAKWALSSRLRLLIGIISIIAIVALGLLAVCLVSCGSLLSLLAENTNPPDYDVSWRPDGQMLAVDGYSLELFTEDLLERDWLACNTNESSVIAWSPDGDQLVQAGCVIRIWDIATRQSLIVPGEHVCTGAVSWNRTGNRFATGGTDDNVRIWNADTLNLELTLVGHTDDVSSIAWNSDGSVLASGSSDGTVKTWNTETGEQLLTLQSDMYVYSISWNSTSDLLAIGGRDTQLRIWNTETGQVQWAYDAAQRRSSIYTVEWSPDYSLIATASSDTVSVWNPSTGQQVRAFEGHGGLVHSIDWSPDGSLLASVSADNTIRIWDVATGEALHSYTIDPQTCFR